jgi:hypothetical protein
LRFHIHTIWLVAVVGEEPPAEAHHQIEQTFAAGESVRLPAEILFLRERRRAATQLGRWVAGHYREGGDT